MSIGHIKGMIRAAILLTLAVPGWAQRGPGWGMRGINQDSTCWALIDSLPKQAVDVTEAAGVSYLREQEQLAHDVYVKLYAKWGSRPFENIFQSEQRHFDALKLLLDRYGLVDPAANNALGDFSDAGLQTLYKDLVAQGELSLLAALRVGATIEDLNLHTLETALATTDNDDFKAIYQNLHKGSRNHMRAFADQLDALGETYAAQYIGATTLADILAGPYEAGMGYGPGAKGPGMVGPCNGTCRWGNRTPPNTDAGSYRRPR